MTLSGAASDEMARPNSTRRRVPGLVLKAARKARGVTQETMAKRLDVRLATASDRETATDVSWDTWLSWAIALGMTHDEAQTPPPPWTAPDEPEAP